MTKPTTTKRTPEDSTFVRMLKELERTLCFTDVPCGVMEFQDVSKKSTSKQDTTTTSWMKRLECAVCFTDLKDLEEPHRLSKKVCTKLVECVVMLFAMRLTN